MTTKYLFSKQGRVQLDRFLVFLYQSEEESTDGWSEYSTHSSTSRQQTADIQQIQTSLAVNSADTSYVTIFRVIWE